MFPNIFCMEMASLKQKSMKLEQTEGEGEEGGEEKPEESPEAEQTPDSQTLQAEDAQDPNKSTASITPVGAESKAEDAEGLSATLASEPASMLGIWCNIDLI